MRKIIFAFLLFLLTTPVYAQNDNQIRYKYYRFKKVLGPIVTKNEVNNQFPLIDESNYFLSDFSDLSTKKPLNNDERIIYEYDGFHYLKVPKVNSITIKVIDDSYLSDISIKSIKGHLDFISDNDSNILTNNMTINYELNDYFDINDLMINYKSGNNKEKHMFNVYFKYDGKVISELYTLVFANINHYILGSQSEIKKDTYENVYLLQKSEDSNLIYQGPIKLYQYQDYKYQSYKLEKDYYDGYLTGPIEDYIYKDETMYINDFLFKDNKENTFSTFLNNKTYLKDSSNSTFTNTEKKQIINNQKPLKYNKVLKVDKVTNSRKNDYKYILFVLIILLIIMVKIKSMIKKQA